MPDPSNFSLWISSLAAGAISSFWSLLIVVLLAGLIFRAVRWAFPQKKTRRPKKA